MWGTQEAPLQRGIMGLQIYAKLPQA